MADVFISYKSDRRNAAEHLSEILLTTAIVYSGILNWQLGTTSPPLSNVNSAKPRLW
jgi:regulatory protein YycH of two-component signal transduction system YycFG